MGSVVATSRVTRKESANSVPDELVILSDSVTSMAMFSGAGRV